MCNGGLAAVFKTVLAAEIEVSKPANGSSHQVNRVVVYPSNQRFLVQLGAMHQAVPRMDGIVKI